jgi:hypothetical protein
MSDEAVARLTVPLTGNERLVASAFAGYLYARIAGADGTLTRAYDEFLGGGTLGYKFPNVPLSALASYTVLSLRGGDAPGFPIAGRAYQYVFVTLRSDLFWGRGTPSLFGEPSEQVRGR